MTETADCLACGLPTDKIHGMPKHGLLPSSESDRCLSRPREDSHLECMYAAGHECAHTARVRATGRHFWKEGDAA